MTLTSGHGFNLLVVILVVDEKWVDEIGWSNNILTDHSTHCCIFSVAPRAGSLSSKYNIDDGELVRGYFMTCGGILRVARRATVCSNCTIRTYLRYPDLIIVVAFKSGTVSSSRVEGAFS